MQNLKNVPFKSETLKIYLHKLLFLFATVLTGTLTVSGQNLVANFTASPTGGCSPLIVNFQDMSTGNPVAWAWDLGNGNTSALQNPSATYFIPGSYTVTLTVTDAGGNTNTLVRQQLVTVDNIPTVNFTVDNQSGCFPLRTQFTDLSTPGAGSSNVAWQWDFGDGNTSSLQHPLHTYTAAGTYTVTLRVTTDKGCDKAVSKPNYITVTPGVTSSFTNTLPTVCSAPATINFTNTSSGPGTLSWQWDFGDGSPVSNIQNPSHTYTTAGSYTVTLITTSSAGCEDTARTATPITIGGINASFTGPDSICVNTPASFTNTSTPGPAGSQWYFGDGGSSTQIDPTYIYTVPGTYTVRLYNSYANCSDSASSVIVVSPVTVADFNAAQRARCQPDFTVTFQDRSTGATSWLWNFGDGNTSTIQNPTHTYSDYGSFQVTLIVSNGNCTDTFARPNFINIRRPAISIPTLPARGCVPFQFTFNPVINSVDAITSYSWSFGDGGTSTLANPTHTYTAQGTYTVRLYVTSSTGCTDSLVLNNAVRIGTKPSADFSAAPSPVCALQSVQFTDLSTAADEWVWEFGDGNSSNAQNPTHNYTDTGYFNVTLVAINNGCGDTITKPAYIRVLPPIARFASAANCANRLQFSFTDQSVAAQTWSWDFGDGSPVSTVQNPVHVFPALGTYNVTLTVTNGSCTNSITHTIQTIDQNPDFTVDASPVCRGSVSTFTPFFQVPGSIATLLWDFGNGVQANSGVGPYMYQYPASGTYTVTLVSTDLNGCTDTIRKNNVLRVNGPYADFNALNAAGCTNLNTTFTDNSTTDGVNAIVRWHFDFGDGSSQTFTAPPFPHTYTTPGNYTVKMVITDASGCSDSLTKIDMINATDPVPDFVTADTMTCPAAIVSFTNTSSATGFTSNWDFGDGTTSTVTNPTHSYADTGWYTVRLIITDAYGCSDTVTKNNYIRVDRPVALIRTSDSLGACIPMEVNFTNGSSFYIASSWDFGDGSPGSTLQDPIHFYYAPGTYIVRLVVTSPGGCTDTAYQDIVVDDTTGTVINYSPLAGCNPLPVTFNTVTSAVIQSYFWDFGDGTTTTTTAPDASHVYSSFGNFVPKVIMLDPSGCQIGITGLDTIKIIGANIDFGLSPALLCDSGYVTFSDSTTASDPITSYNWTFGDGQTSTDQNPVHYYSSPGIFDVTLSVTTQSGCTNSFTLTDAVKVVSRPLIRINGNNDICVFDSILHSGVFVRPDTSLVTWAWTFPNGNTSSLQNPPFQVYTMAGNFTVTAISTNSSGCKDTATQDIAVHALPTVMMPGQMTIQLGFSALIPASYSSGTNAWLWNPARGLSCINCPAPEASPKFTTLYRVDFSDSNGCRNSDSILVTVVCKDGNLFMPNTFSPNGDGSNDVFYPRGRGIYSIKALRIFSRWGEVVFEKKDFPINNMMAGWDGKYKGRDPHPDVYVYQVEVVCENGDMLKLTGNVALVL